ncbi:MAG: amidohydrolase family protein [Dehalococcoidia bacterium]|nr:amidohydrolase family protein [Dehalococcoidia bacterium]
MFIADAQVHVGRKHARFAPGRRAEHHAQKPYPVTPDMVREAMDEAGVDRAVLVPPSWEGDRNDIALDAANRYPDRFAVMGRIPLENPDPEALANWRGQPGMLGLRFTFHLPEHRALLDDGTAEWVWSAAEEHGVPIMVFVPGAVREIDAVAERHPGLRLVIDHLAIREGKDDEAFANLGEVLHLARHPNVAVKASALPCFSSEPYPFPKLHPYIGRVYDTFGPQRMFWGTDWTRLPCSWSEAITLFTEELPWLSEEDKEWIMGRALCEWLGWPLPADA